MRIFGFTLSLICILTFAACSGKVQTNPIPNPKKYRLPHSVEILTTEVKAKYIEDYDEYARNFFNARVVQLKKSIWSIGLERGHFNEW